MASVLPHNGSPGKNISKKDESLKGIKNVCEMGNKENFGNAVTIVNTNNCSAI